MEGIGKILMLSTVLGVSSFLIGVSPLSFDFSGERRLQLSTFGNGLLLGAALGVIIPEGIEAVSENKSGSPTYQIALSLIFGFTLMLIIEQSLAPHGPNINYDRPHETIFEEFDLSTPVTSQNIHLPAPYRTSARENQGPGRAIIAYPLTLGLVIHSLADGLALGASSVGGSGSDGTLSLVVFFALIIHKSPTALALTSSLLSTSLSHPEIRRHVAVFSAATPFGALVSYVFLNFFGAGTGNWTGTAMLISGGTFLYVATVIQSVGGHSHDDTLPVQELNKIQRVSLLVTGIFLPFLIGSMIGHDHAH